MEDRVKATYYELYAKICTVIAYGLLGATLIAAFILRDAAILKDTAMSDGMVIVLMIPSVIFLLLGRHFKKRRLQLLCTVRTTARRLYTVTHGSRRGRRRYPVVEYEVEGRTYTAELDIPSYFGSEEEEYAICYDPHDPAVARLARGDD